MTAAGTARQSKGDAEERRQEAGKDTHARRHNGAVKPMTGDKRHQPRGRRRETRKFRLFKR